MTKGILSKAIAYTDTTAINVGYLPPNSIITHVYVTVATAFDAGGNDYVDVGNADTANAYANDMDVSSTGRVDGTVAGTGEVVSASAATLIKAVYVPAGSTPTDGAGYVHVEYVQL